MDGDDLAPFWYLALLGTLRLGELVAPTWADMDFDRGIVVRQTVTRDADGKAETREPKSA